MNYRSRILNRIQVDLNRDNTKPLVYSSFIVVFLFSMTFMFLIPSLEVIGKLKERNAELTERKLYLENKFV
jgi:hypothetical protein